MITYQKKKNRDDSSKQKNEKLYFRTTKIKSPLMLPVFLSQKARVARLLGRPVE